MTKLRYDPPPNVGRYAVVVDKGWYTSFTIMNGLGHAKSSLRHAVWAWYGASSAIKGGRILEMVNGQWYTLYEVHKGDTELPWIVKIYDQQGKVLGTSAKPMTREEYADFRVRVFAEQHGIEI